MKMRESRNAVTYVMPAILSVKRFSNLFPKNEAGIWLYLIYVQHLVGGYTHNPPDEVRTGSICKIIFKFRFLVMV